ncbi:hypothetical protein F5146DRAFT_939180, partial [Armillaria mellea]
MPEDAHRLDCPKVTANFPDSRGSQDSDHSGLVSHNRSSRREKFPVSHRGREKAREQQEKNRRDLLEAAEASNPRFWKILRKLGDPVKPRPTVSAEELKGVFEQRINPPECLPPEFDEIQHRLNSMRTALIPDRTEDHSAGKYFSLPWNGEEVAELKEHIRTRSLMDSASSDDGVLYSQIMDIENDDLADLFNHYRLLGIESCFFRFFLLGIHMRTTKWAEENNLIPDYQNGFRSGYRTNNNPLILRCAIESARAQRRPLYVAVVDATNAFPSTDRATLWLKLQRLGMGGPIFD